MGVRDSTLWTNLNFEGKDLLVQYMVRKLHSMLYILNVNISYQRNTHLQMDICLVCRVWCPVTTHGQSTSICKVHTDLNVADPLTKPLPRAKHDQHQDAMGVRFITM